MSNWIFVCDPKKINADLIFKENRAIDLPMNKAMEDMHFGDIVFLYFGGDIKEIRWRCMMRDCNYYLKDGDITHSKEKTEEYNKGPFIELWGSHAYTGTDLLSYRHLKENGLDLPLRGAHPIGEQLSAYIESVDTLEQDPIAIGNHFRELPLTTLKRTAIRNGKKQPSVYRSSTTHHVSDPYVKAYAYRRAKYKCQLCGKSNMARGIWGEAFLEVHHLKPLLEEGSDTIDNVVVLCPNCHKQMHLYTDPKEIELLKKKAEE